MKRAVRIGLSRVVIEVKQLLRDRESALFNFAFPMILLVIFGSVFSSQEIGFGDVTFAQYFLAGMLASGIFYSSFQNLSISIPMEREDGTLKRLQGAPIPKASYFIGKIGMVLASYLVQATLLLALGVALYGVRLPSDPAKWLTFAWVSLLGLASCTLLGLAFSVVPKHGRGASAVVSPVVLVLQFTSGVFFVYSQVPEWMRSFASVFPLKWLTQAMRSVFLPDGAKVIEVAGSWELRTTALVLGIWTVVGFALALRVFRWTARGTT